MVYFLRATHGKRWRKSRLTIHPELGRDLRPDGPTPWPPLAHGRHLCLQRIHPGLLPELLRSWRLFSVGVLRNVIRVKDDMVANAGLKHPWLSCGLPDELVVHNGAGVPCSPSNNGNDAGHRHHLLSCADSLAETSR